MYNKFDLFFLVLWWIFWSIWQRKKVFDFFQQCNIKFMKDIKDNFLVFFFVLKMYVSRLRSYFLFLTQYQMSNFRLVQIETNCRHFKVHLKWKISTIWGRKHFERKEKLLVTSNFSFSHNVFHSYISLVHQNSVLCGNGLNVHVIHIFPGSVRKRKLSFRNIRWLSSSQFLLHECHRCCICCTAP